MNTKPMMRGILGACGLAAAIGAASVGTGSNATAAAAVRPDPYDHLPASITLNGLVRDFRARNTPGGHPDMEYIPTRGRGHYVNMVADTLGSDGRPVFRSTGNKVTTQWRDSQGRNIISPKPYIMAKPGDVAGVCETVEGGAVNSATSFSQLFALSPQPGVTMEDHAFPIVLERQPGTPNYVYADNLDTQFASVHGYFQTPGGGQAQGGNRNHNLTYELSSTFTFRRGGDGRPSQVFKFAGDDDMWVFIDNRLVIDAGGVHETVEQWIDLDRLEWLVDGETYTLKSFYAERDRPTSFFRIETTIELRNAPLPQSSGLFD